MFSVIAGEFHWEIRHTIVFNEKPFQSSLAMHHQDHTRYKGSRMLNTKWWENIRVFRGVSTVIGLIIFAATSPCVSNAAEPVADVQLDAASVKGAESCRKCHEAEHAAWSQSTHSRNHERLSSSAGKKYAQAYGGTDACKTCHSTPHTDTAQFAGPVGVSCESCHMPAGGDSGWFDLHSNYGADGLKREEETAAHLEQRMAGCDASGMIRAGNTDALARNCYTCHIVADEKLLAAGHKTGHSDFDLIPWMQGEVRHNFQIDQKQNAESPSLLNARDGVSSEQRKRVLLVVGKIVELEICLRNLSAIDSGNLKEGYAGRRGWAGRAEDAFDYLAEEIAPVVENENVTAAVNAVTDLTLGRKFKDQAAAAVAADKLKIAAALLTAEQGDVDLAGVDNLIDDLAKPQGKTYQP